MRNTELTKKIEKVIEEIDKVNIVLERIEKRYKKAVDKIKSY